jgi:hypothetical protein
LHNHTVPENKQEKSSWRIFLMGGETAAPPANPHAGSDSARIRRLVERSASVDARR